MSSDQSDQRLPGGGVRDRGAVQIGAIQHEPFDPTRMIGRVPRGDRPARRAGENDDRFGAYGINHARKNLDLVVESHRGRTVSI
jgi:hypothetical protein